MRYATWLLGNRKDQMGKYVMGYLQDPEKKHLEENLSEAGNDNDDYGLALSRAISTISTRNNRKITKYIQQSIASNIKLLNYCGESEIEKNSRILQKMFELTDQEMGIIIFLFIISHFDDPEYLFDIELKCDRITGRKYLSNSLGLSQQQTVRTLGKLENMGLLYNGHNNFSLEDDIACLLQNPESNQLSKRFFQQINPDCIPLDFHFIDPDVLSYLKLLVGKKSDAPTHLLLWGPPGTGKTSFGHSLAATAKVPVYSITRDEANRSENRRNAIVACLNMTGSGNGSIIIVDEADNLLNTRSSWLLRGETQDKGWFNQLLEKPGARIIWITNSKDEIEDSVLRRFAYTLPFKPFSIRQRVTLFRRILLSNRIKRFFSDAHIQKLARNYPVAAGPFDLAVKKAKDIGASNSREFHRAIRISLDGHLELTKGETRHCHRPPADKAYSLEGLNVSVVLDEVVDQLENFCQVTSRRSRALQDGIALLFHGPPGTGKTALANYLGKKLDRDVILRRYSDLQSMWVGQGEKNIRETFREASREEAVLVVDEADSMLFSRNRAERSWEISFTNEFLTQMETFPGILICTTNRLADLDAAAIRRFTFKIEFDYLTAEGNTIFYRKILKPMVGKPLRDKHLKRIARIKWLAPGDFKTVRQAYTYRSRDQVSHAKLITGLEEEAGIKSIHQARRTIGF
jgi:SpoVK/Ycf46/Vps4 family AAA+-type ATPase